MNRGLVRLLLITVALLAFPFRSPAPLIYRPTEGWTYEPVGGAQAKWQTARAKDQLDIAQNAFDRHDYGTALKAARRVVKVWPLSDYAPQAQYLVGRCYEATGKDEKAFNEYQKLLEKQRKVSNYQEVLQRQMVITDRFLAGKWFKLWGYIPFFPSMERTAEMYEKIVKNGPYSEIAPQAQLKIGTAREKQHNFALAAKAYETAADRYHDRPPIAAEALYRAGLSHKKQAATAEYDQSAAGKAIASFTDFKTLYPDEPRVAETDKMIGSLKNEQARGNFQIAKFYEKHKKWDGALVYYNEVQLQDPDSPYAPIAQQKIFALKKRTQTAAK